MYLLIATEIGL